MTALWDELHAATQVLVGSGPVKQRLIDAWRSHLAPLRELDLPEAARQQFGTLKSAMHEAHATGGLSAPEASVRKMSERDAAAFAAGILDLYTLVTAAGETESAPRLRIVGSVDDVGHAEQDVPAFLSRA